MGGGITVSPSLNYGMSHFQKYELLFHQSPDQRFINSQSCRLTDGGEDAGEAEVVHGVERKKVVKELLPFFLTAEESVTLVKLPRKETSTKQKDSVFFIMSSITSKHRLDKWGRNSNLERTDNS